ncbi:MAG: hypothetical protein NVS3B12_26190 [Acidimicrobiales bacterium]
MWLVAAAALGGWFGTIGRYALTSAWPAGPGQFPVAVLVINTSGALALGLLVGVLADRRRMLRVLLGSGVLGGWTTMSTLATDMVILSRHGSAVVAAADGAASLLAGLIAAAAGARLGRRCAGPAARPC